MTKRTRYFMLGSATFLTVGLTVGLAAYYGGIPGFAQPAGPEELNYVPNDAAVVAYANVRQLMDSKFRQQVKGLEPADRQKGQDEFRAETGINIETDIDYVVACMLPGAPADTPKDKKNGFVLAHGNFDQARIEALIREKGGVEERYKDLTLFTHAAGPKHADAETMDLPDPTVEHEMAIGFLEPKVVVLGTPAALHRVIDLKHGQSSVRANDKMMDLIKGVAGGNAWAVGRFDMLKTQAHLPEQVASQLPAVTWFTATGHVNGGLSGTVSVEAKDPEAANNLRQVITGFMALGRLQADSKPELKGMLNSIRLEGTGTTVAVSFELPDGALDALKAAGMQRHHRTE
ncbi:MAG TPA: hypothetical protein VGK32_10585 [Vicinamibacterales bacterium]|jgi:hypothetical protein